MRLSVRLAFLLITLLAVQASAQTPAVRVGAPAPGFTVTDDHGVKRSLSDFRGKFIVLEWHEKGCPYVTKHYRTGHMQRLQSKWIDRGVTWLLLTSSAKGFHSYLTPEESRAYLSELKATPTAMLLDTPGVVSRLYGVTTALHMVIVDPSGRVVYNGAIDDKPTTQFSDLSVAKNYVDQALTEALAARTVSTPTSEPYGCPIHYATGKQ
jgi:peroxiredoxin